METDVMGKVEVAARLENQYDVTRLQLGEITPDQVRTVEIPVALVATGASGLCVPRKLIDNLGLLLQKTRKARTTNGEVERGIFGPVRLTVQGRDCSCYVSELPDDCPTLIGQLPLEEMDFVVDPRCQLLVGNPAHGGEAMHDEY
jgi:predicted aspartyl protease